MVVPNFTAEEVFKNKTRRKSVTSNVFDRTRLTTQYAGSKASFRRGVRYVTSRTSDKDESSISQAYIRDYQGYVDCWMDCWASSGYLDSAVKKCQIECGGPR